MRRKMTLAQWLSAATTATEVLLCTVGAAWALVIAANLIFTLLVPLFILLGAGSFVQHPANLTAWLGQMGKLGLGFLALLALRVLLGVLAQLRTRTQDREDVRRVSGQRIQTLRTAKRWTQRQLADRVGCSEQLISRLERGETAGYFHLLDEVASALGVPPGDILPQPGGRPVTWWILRTAVLGVLFAIGIFLAARAFR
jgi:DNA-binding Xre family transcriptional regulator